MTTAVDERPAEVEDRPTWRPRKQRRKRRDQQEQEPQQSAAEQQSAGGRREPRVASRDAWHGIAAAGASMVTTIGGAYGPTGLAVAAGVGGATVGGVAAVRKFAPKTAERLGLKSPRRDRNTRGGRGQGLLGGRNNGLGGRRGRLAAGMPGLGGKGRGLFGRGRGGDGAGRKGLLGRIFAGRSKGKGLGSGDGASRKGLLGRMLGRNKGGGAGGAGDRKKGLLGRIFAGRGKGKGLKFPGLGGKKGSGLPGGGRGSGLGLGGSKGAGRGKGIGLSRLFGGSGGSRGGKGRFGRLLGKGGKKGPKWAKGPSAWSGQETYSRPKNRGADDGTGSTGSAWEKAELPAKGVRWTSINRGRATKTSSSGEDNTTSKTKGAVMANPFATVNDALAKAKQHEFNLAIDLIDWVDNAPETAGQQAEVWKTHAERIQEKIQIGPQFSEAIREIARSLEVGRDITALAATKFRQEHERQIHEILNPDPKRDAWDPLKNRENM